MPAAPTEQAPVLGAPAPATRPEMPPRPPAPALRGHRVALWWGTLLTGAAFCLITFYAKGGLNLESMTSTEMVLTIGAGLVVAGATLLGPRERPLYGSWALGLLLAFSALSAISVVWSVQPEDSWHDAGRMLAYSGVFAAAVALARVAPERWPAIIGGLTLAATIVCGYAVLTKVFPATLGSSNAYARLEEPYGYWNAIGLTAAMGAICCLWLGARRRGHALLSALAYPAMGLMLVTLVLAYSRGALAAFLVGLVLWFCIVPLRLRGASVLIVGGIGAVGVLAWDFSRSALSSEHVGLAERTAAGHELGALLLAVLLLLSVAGVAIGFSTSRRAPSMLARRQAGAALLALIAIIAIAFAGALAHSHRGFTGSISHAFDALTNPNARPPANTPGRLTAVASVRARYWKEALQVFEAHPALGAGAEGYATAHLRYRTETLTVRHAHGFLVQTLADLGLVGLGLVLALLIAWMAAAGRATHPLNRRWSPWSALRSPRSGERPGWRPLRGGDLLRYTPERIGMLSMLCLVVVFGVHSLVDWTWYVPGNACVALLCAGWLAGRGPLLAGDGPPLPRPASRSLAGIGYGRWALAGAVLLMALVAAWSQWQPQRSAEARQEALALLAANPDRARAAAETAVSRDPLSADALFALAHVQDVAGRPALARATLQRSVRLQPSNPRTWLELGRFDLMPHPRAALQELQAAIYLNPESIAPEAIAPTSGQREPIEIYNDYIHALRANEQASAALRSARVRRAREASAARRAARRRSAPGSARSRTPRPAG